MTSVKKKLVCIICLKRFDSENKKNISLPLNNSSCKVTSVTTEDLQGDEKGESNGSTNLYERFLRFVSQYFKLRNFTGRFIACAKEAKNEDGSPAKLETFCESCGELVSEICGLYKQLRTAQLFLVWKLGQVGELMRKGSKPGPRSQRPCKLADRLTNVAMMKQMNVDAARPVGAFRKALQLKCINATRKSLPDVVVHKGLFIDHWKFTYSATKQTLIRLITVFLLASSQILKSNHIQPSIITNNEEQIVNRRPCRNSRKRAKLSQTTLTVKNELIDDGDGGNVSIGEDDDGDYIADNFGNDSDSDWSQGALSQISVDSNVSLKKSNKKTETETFGNPRENLRSRRNVVVRAEEDGDRDSSSSQDSSDDEENHLPKKRIRRQYIPESEKTIKCPHCPKLVVDRRGLARHLQMVHRSYIPCFCKHCGMRCRNQVEQVRHHREMHRGKLKRVRKPRIPFKAKSAGIKRRRVRPSASVKGTGVKCRVSTSTTDKRRQKAILSRCPKCSEVFPRKQLKRHLSAVHKLGTAKHECPYCFQTLLGEKRFKAHITSHEERPVNEVRELWYCQVCGQYNNSEDSLKVHMNESHQDKYVCTVCNEELETGKLLRDHFLINHETEEKQFQCLLCRTSFTTQQFYDIHRSLAHRDKRKFVCDFNCGHFFDTIVEMSDHLKNHINDSKAELKIFQCETCKMGFLKKYSLALHQLLHTSKESAGNGYECPKCNENLSCKESLIIHYKFVHGDGELKEKRYHCKLCPKRFSTKVWLSTHVRLHDVPLFEGKYICEVCDIRCVDNIALSIHHQEHEQKEKKQVKRTKGQVITEGLLKMKRGIMNQICKRDEMDRRYDPASPPPPSRNKSVKIKTKKKSDKLISEEIEYAKLADRIKNKLSCKVENCGEDFESAYLLRKHLENEHEAGIPEVEKSIQCFFCSKRFCYQQSHEIHERAQHKEKLSGKFRCEVESCRKRYLSLEDFHKHLESHFGEPDTSYVGISHCGKCNWGFLTSESRDLHQLIHDLSGDSPGGTKDEQLKDYRKPLKDYRIICDEPNCGKIFRNRSRLLYHKQSEHSTKDWICDLCGFAFFYESKLKIHMKTHEEPKFTCDECGILLMSKSCFDTHKKNKHNPNRTANSICSVCGKSFFTKEGLKNHFESTHKAESEWRLKCPKCPKRFYRRLFLNLHLKKCDGSGEEVKAEENIEAGESGSTIKESAPRRSEAEHIIEQSVISCDECGQIFTENRSLREHKDSKHNPNRTKNSVCSTCGKSFFTRGGLRYHVESTHKPESEWRLKCPKCPRRFFRRMFLNLHLKKCDESGGDGGSESTPNGPPRRSARERKKKRNDEEEEMTDQSTTEDEMEQDKPQIKPSSSSSTISQQGQQNQFQDLLRLPYQPSLISHQLQHESQIIWPTSGIPQPPGIQHPSSTLPLQHYPQTQFHRQPLINHEFMGQQLPQQQLNTENSPETVYQSPTSSC